MSSAESPETPRPHRKGRRNPPPALPVWAVVLSTVFVVDHLSVTGPLGLVLTR